ncbi:MAG: tRNA (N(6)-L-threonylcarbamoyladenosine(37)-C(2))-methylthiotransferase MtaB [Gammaproteobacteria bacterium]|nr:tRNA (N(6)-L-threonylcarbamoyladenosine(37)-C(2))-methylthiotransferase MtaB [Gammaproteobacteria bacterium]
MKRVAYITFGCRLNQYDTETVRTLLENDGGYQTVAAGDGAEVFVVNTCSVTARADATARKTIRRIHRQHPEAQIVVTGCYAQRAPQELAALDGVSVVVGAKNRAEIVELVSSPKSARPRVAVSPVNEAVKFLEVPITEMMERSRAYVKVQEGCNESCTFCIVPQTRGRSRSRARDRVLDQVRGLVQRGYVEVVLTGVHVGDYGLDLAGGRRMLADLIREILEVPGLERFRLSSIEPASVSDEIIDLMAAQPKFARHFHIPFQSGSNAILSRMKRRYSAEYFADLIENITGRVPGCGIGSDVICGFPGETEADFQATFDRLVDLPITYLHAFTYSVRPGSEAEAFGDRVPAEVKKRRVHSLKRLARDKNRAFREKHVGEMLQVLFEGAAAGNGDRISGFSDNYLKVEAEGAASSRVEAVRITDLSEDCLKGERLGRHASAQSDPDFDS